MSYTLTRPAASKLFYCFCRLVSKLDLGRLQRFVPSATWAATRPPPFSPESRIIPGEGGERILRDSRMGVAWRRLERLELSGETLSFNVTRNNNNLHHTVQVWRQIKAVIVSTKAAIVETWSLLERLGCYR